MSSCKTAGKVKKGQKKWRPGREVSNQTIWGLKRVFPNGPKEKKFYQVKGSVMRAQGPKKGIKNHRGGGRAEGAGGPWGGSTIQRTHKQGRPWMGVWVGKEKSKTQVEIVGGLKSAKNTVGGREGGKLETKKRGIKSREKGDNRSCARGKKTWKSTQEAEGKIKGFTSGDQHIENLQKGNRGKNT